jgi:DNA-binding transcriptional MerR regulator
VTEEPAVYGPEELAERAGVSRRTVRYYVQRGLLPAPRGLGRGKHYGESHLARLLRIRELQEAGVPLEEVAARIEGRACSPEVGVNTALPAQTSWTRMVLAHGVELHLMGRRLSQAQLQKLSELVTQAIGDDEP